MEKLHFPESFITPRTPIENILISAAKNESMYIRKLYLAAKFLTKEFGNDENLAGHLKVLTTRQFPDSPRPYSCNGCNKFDFPTLINPKAVCGGMTQIDLLIQITTIPSDQASRNAIRNTWASLTENNTAIVRHMFLFGTGWKTKDQQMIEKESELHGDVLQQGYRDAYYNLSYKVGMGYQWALEHCQRAQFILRTACDNFINIPGMLKYLNMEAKTLQRTQIGRVHTPMVVMRNRNTKFYISPMEYPPKFYPPFAIGSAFVYSMAAVKEVMAAAPNIPFFALEDVWFGLVMQQIEMEVENRLDYDIPLHEPDMNHMLNGGCPFYGDFQAIHIGYTNPNPEAEPTLIESLWLVCPNVRSIHTWEDSDQNQI